MVAHFLLGCVLVSWSRRSKAPQTGGLSATGMELSSGGGRGLKSAGWCAVLSVTRAPSPHDTGLGLLQNPAPVSSRVWSWEPLPWPLGASVYPFVQGGGHSICSEVVVRGQCDEMPVPAGAEEMSGKWTPVGWETPGKNVRGSSSSAVFSTWG